jgi:hypothetical protein
MSDQATQPYSLQVTPAKAGHFYWEIRRKGRLVQRSDRAFAGEENARKRGREAVERLLHGADERR